MSFKKYRFIDLFIFFILFVVFEYLIETSAIRWFPEQIFSVSLLLPLSIIVMVRWDFYSIFNVLAYSALYVLYTNRPGSIDQYLIYLLGAIGLCLCIFILTKKRSDLIFSKWYYSLFFVIFAYLVMNIFRSIGAIIFAKQSLAIIIQYIFTDSLNLVFAIIVVLVGRKANSLIMNQKRYLFKLDKEKKKELEKLKEMTSPLDEYHG